jgi:hypothetical protein
MEQLTREKRAWLAEKGIVFDSAVTHLLEESDFAADAQPSLITVGNSGVPAYLANYLDPKLIEVLFTPMKAEKIFGPVKKGDATTITATFEVVESTGETSSYGDYNNNGTAGVNVQFPQRQSYLYQTVTSWGDLELERAALAFLDLAGRKNIASALVLNKFQNKSWFYGIDGLQNYGILNDPELSAPIAPCSKAFNGNVSGPWTTSGVITATAAEIYQDIQAMFYRVNDQLNGLIDRETPMLLVMSPNSSVALTATNSFNVNVYDQLKKNFPNMRFETAPEYDTASGELVQLIIENIDGQETGVCAFNEKMRAFPIFRDLSSFRQKKMQGTFGAIIFRPACISQLIGV